MLYKCLLIPKIQGTGEPPQDLLQEKMLHSDDKRSKTLVSYSNQLIRTTIVSVYTVHYEYMVYLKKTLHLESWAKSALLVSNLQVKLVYI